MSRLSRDMSDALSAAVAASADVMAIRQGTIVGDILKSFRSSAMAKIDCDEITTELSDLAVDVAFDTQGFPLDGTGGVQRALDARLRLVAARDRVVAIVQGLRQMQSKLTKIMRVGSVYIRQHGALTAKTVKHVDAAADVCLREVVEAQDDVRMLSEHAHEVLSTIDHKVKVLDAWFNLHKQYVFMKGQRGPYGERKTYEEADSDQPGTRRLGHRSSRND